LAAAGYRADAEVARVLYLAMQLGRPVLVEGPAGSGKTELAKAFARASGARLIRLQCYEGLDESKVLYEWDHRKQLLRIQSWQEADPRSRPGTWRSLHQEIFSDQFLLTRPLLEAMRAPEPSVLLVDGVDLMGTETEAVVLEALSDYQVSVPELGAVHARQIPVVLLTSAGNRELSDPLRRRCLFLATGYPDPAREREIVAANLPGVAHRLRSQVASAVAELGRTIELEPSGEHLEWASALQALEQVRSGAPAAGEAGLHSDEDAASESSSAADGVLETVQAFVTELRAAGIPVSVSENLDALRAMQLLPLERRDALKGGLASTLVKDSAHWTAFETLFDVFFALRGGQWPEADGPETEAAAARSGRPGHMASWSDVDVSAALLRALAEGDWPLTRAVAKESVTRYADIRPGRRMRGVYYTFRTLRHLQLDGIVERLLDLAARQSGGLTDLEVRLLTDDYERRVDGFRKEVEAEIRRRLVLEQGVAALAGAVRKPLPEDLDFMDASTEELEEVRRALQPLTRKLAVRISRKQLHRRKGSVDFRRTVRRSLSSGGVPLDLYWRRAHPSRGEVIVIADMSGSVAAFARFTVLLIHALSEQFRRIRTFAFVDDIDEITKLFTSTGAMGELVERINQHARVTWFDGHSDYGHAFEGFLERWGHQLTPSTTVLILGDGRNNYRASRATTVSEMAKRSRRVLWLNPEPIENWDKGDSVITEYAGHCSGVYECRNLRQLERFVEHIL
jgi:uncharacterized protein with von Willebrand factor type A (vWA) domain